MSYIGILITYIFVNNFILVKFMGICPFIGVSKNMGSRIINSIYTINHSLIPPLKIVGLILIFLDLAAVRRKTLLSFRLGIFFLTL